MLRYKNRKESYKAFRTAREFFASLYWSYEKVDGYPPVFLEHELRDQPLKWLKYLLLERVGATTAKILDDTIRRYSITHYEQAMLDCKNMIEYSNQKSMIVVKIVYLDQAGQLPNFRIYSTSDIDLVFTQIRTLYYKSAHQIWLCLSSVNPEGSDLGGRIIRTNRDLVPMLTEILWYASPRMIEEFNTAQFSYPFIRAYKNPGSRMFQVNELYIPEKYKHPRTKYLTDFQLVLEELKRNEDALERLENILYNAGANELSIEFKLSDDRFAIIDWDTEIETALS